MSVILTNASRFVAGEEMLVEVKKGTWVGKIFTRQLLKHLRDEAQQAGLDDPTATLAQRREIASKVAFKVVIPHYLEILAIIDEAVDGKSIDGNLTSVIESLLHIDQDILQTATQEMKSYYLLKLGKIVALTQNAQWQQQFWGLFFHMLSPNQIRNQVDKIIEFNPLILKNIVLESHKLELPGSPHLLLPYMNSEYRQRFRQIVQEIVRSTPLFFDLAKIVASYSEDLQLPNEGDWFREWG